MNHKVQRSDSASKQLKGLQKQQESYHVTEQKLNKIKKEKAEI